LIKLEFVTELQRTFRTTTRCQRN